MIKKLYLKFGGGCYTARVSNEGVKTLDYKILLCKFEFYYDADHQILLQSNLVTVDLWYQPKKSTVMRNPL